MRIEAGDRSIASSTTGQPPLKRMVAGLVPSERESVMRCGACDGTGMRFGAIRELDKACLRCKGSGMQPDDQFEERVREAISKIGMVYMVRDDVNGRVKIGTSLNPLERLRALQTGSSVPLRLVAMWGGGRKAEQDVHAIWPQRRLAGEWFDDRDREISRIIVSSIGSSGIVWPSK